MYTIIERIIDHTWQSNYTSDQQYIYYICGAMVLILTVVLIDIIKSVFASFMRK